ncbi:MAG: APC family permease [Athalassotoga sp.]|uniref:APC family permease n=1 Tax=Athalassotoga sp. TaxID=2022597 RepID=UPI003CFCCAA7
MKVKEKISAEESDRKLKKVLTFQDLFFLSMGGIIGSGWLLGVAAGAGTAGPASVLSWIIGGVIVLFIALTLAEVAGSIPKSGAIVRYPHLSYGSYTGFIFGWAYLIGAITTPTIEAEAVLNYVSTYVPGLFRTVGNVAVLTPFGILIGVFLIMGFFLLNWFGIKFLGKFNSIATWWKLILPSLTFVFLLFMFNGSNFTSYGGFAPMGIGSIFYAIPAAGIIFSYLGFRQSVEFGGEAKNPQKDIPRATILSIVTAIALYSLLQLAFIGAIKWPAGINWANLTSSDLGTSPFFTELKYSGIALFAAFAELLLVDAWISPSGTGWIYLGTSSRVLYGMAADGYLPSSLLKLQKKTAVPYLALIVSTVISVFFFLPFPSWYLFVGFSTSATVLTYIISPVALQIFRKNAPDIKKPFKLKYASIISPIAFVGGALIVYWSGITTLTMIIYATFVGIPIFYITYVHNKLKISKVFSYTVAFIEFITSISSIILNYMYVLYPPSDEPMGIKNLVFMTTLLFSFAVFLISTWLTSKKMESNKRVIFTSAYWFFALLFSTILVSYFGSFGIDTVIPFPWDTFLMIPIYTVIYFFAVRAGYKTEDLQKIIEEQYELPILPEIKSEKD